MRKRIIMVSTIVALLGSGAWSYWEASASERCCATCTGGSPCNACTNCKSCKYCKTKGNTCGACKKEKDPI